MARGEWGHNNGRGRWWSYRKTTLIVCSVNIVVALYVLHSLYNTLYMYPISDSHTTSRYSEDQIKKMEESNQMRKASEPTELINLVTQLKTIFVKEESVVKLPQHLRRKFVDEILHRLRSLDAASNATEQREAVETWRKEKLKEAKLLVLGQTINSTILPEEAGTICLQKKMFRCYVVTGYGFPRVERIGLNPNPFAGEIAKYLSSDWSEVSEDIGLWIPAVVVNKEHDDKPEDEEDFDSRILPGRQLPPICHAELHTDYDGLAVRWGLTHHKDSAFECCMACLEQAKHAKPGENKCNVWVYCPSETGCYSPDIYEHKNQECWLKYSEEPKLNFKDRYSDAYRETHPNAPLVVPWVSGVVGE